MIAVQANAFAQRCMLICLLLASFISTATGSASAQVVPTLSPPVFNTPLYQNPFYFPGSTPLIPPIGTPIAPPVDVPIPSSAPEANNRIENSAGTLDGLPGVDMLTSPVSRPAVFNEQFTAPRLEQMTVPQIGPLMSLETEQRADPKIQQLILPPDNTPGVGAQPLLQIRTSSPTLGSQRIDAIPPNAIETARTRLARQGAWSMVGSTKTYVPSINPAPLPTPHAAILESSSYTKLDPLSPEVVADGRAFRAGPPDGVTNSSLAQIKRSKTPLTDFAFHPSVATSLHTSLPKRPLAKPLNSASSSALRPPLRSSALPRQQPSSHQPGMILESPGELKKLP